MTIIDINKLNLNLEKNKNSKSESELEKEVLEEKPEIKIREIPSKVKIISDNKSESKLENEVESTTETFEFSSSSFTAPILKSGEVQELPRELPQAQISEEDKKLFSENIRYSTPNPNFISQGGSSNASSQRTSRIYSTPEQAVARIDPSIKSPTIDFNPTHRTSNFGSDELASLRGEKEVERYKTAEFKAAERSRNKLPWEI